MNIKPALGKIEAMGVIRDKNGNIKSEIKLTTDITQEQLKNFKESLKEVDNNDD